MVINIQFLMKIVILLIFLACYLLIIFEEKIKLKKTEVSIFFSGSMLIILAIFFRNCFQNNAFGIVLKDILFKYCELFLFLIVAMVYINTLKFFRILDFIRNFLILRKWSCKKLFFMTGIFSFFISPFADNLTTTLFMGSVVLFIKSDDKPFVSMSCVNIVVAANAGGVFTPFGDITTLMIWQSGIIDFSLFLKLFLPSFLSFLIPSIIMCMYVKDEDIQYIKESKFFLSRNSKLILILFILTILIAIFFQSYLGITSAIGMMFGFSFLQIFETFVKTKENFNLLDQIIKVEWNTLFFFYGIMLCVGCLDLAGILSDISQILYKNNFFSLEYKHIIANIMIGLISSFVDNVPVTFAVISMNPDMNCGQWLLMTLTVATGGSIFSIGSAAGIAAMGIARNKYTFLSHLKWSWVILLGYFIGILSHIFFNWNFIFVK